MLSQDTKAVLLVDDDQGILTSLGHYLQRSGFVTKTAGCAGEALRLLRNGWFDLVITDLMMDDKTGIELSVEIKQRDDKCGVFILTGQGTMNLAIEALRAGADDFLLKPCDSEELLLRMGKFFEKQDVLRRLKVFEEFLPICMYCKKIRDDKAETAHGDRQWLRVEEYFSRSGKVT